MIEKTQAPIQQYTTSNTRAHAYCGRFAPSPTGPLHFGSLLCALASYLHAKQNKGKWLVRIEDIDTPRIAPSSSEQILETLLAHGLRWDDQAVYQSHRYELYNHYLQRLRDNKHLYACHCTRSQIKARSGSYNGHCRNKGLPFNHHAIRFVHSTNHSQFEDLFWGTTHITEPVATEDPVLKRADGIFSYHLAVVVDDIEQQVTHIVRGIDLQETTPVHLSLYQALLTPAPQYLHIPVVAQKANEKLSKQHYAPAVDNNKAGDNLKLAFIYLGMDVQGLSSVHNVDDLLDWAIKNWSTNLMSKQSELLISVVNGVYSYPDDILAPK